MATETRTRTSILNVRKSLVATRAGLQTGSNFEGQVATSLAQRFPGGTGNRVVVTDSQVDSDGQPTADHWVLTATCTETVEVPDPPAEE
jgi:hypothetical protein